MSECVMLICECADIGYLYIDTEPSITSLPPPFKKCRGMSSDV